MMQRCQDEIIISGFGGQGILFLGKFIASIAMEEGLHVTYIPSYGVEVRGGTANCTVIYSPGAIASPVTSSPTAVFAMNAPSVAKFCPRLRRGGLLIYNESLADIAPGGEFLEKLPVPANALAESAGDRRAANIVMLGAYIARRGFSSLEKAGRMLGGVLKGREELVTVNLKALESGYRSAGGGKILSRP